MRWRRVSEAEVRESLINPDRTEPSIERRINVHKWVGGRLLKVTYVNDDSKLVVITVLEKERVGG
jgi:hypothetical protein